MRRLAAAALLAAWAGACGGHAAPAPAAPATPPATPDAGPVDIADAAPAAAPAPAPPADSATHIETAAPASATVAARIRPYLAARGATLVDVADDGKQLLIATRFDGAPQLHLVRSPQGARIQLTFGAGRARGTFAGGGVVIVGDDGRLARIELTSGQLTPLGEEGQACEAPVLSRDGKQLVYRVVTGDGHDSELWIADSRSTAPARRLLATRGVWQPLDWSRDGTKILAAEHVAGGGARLYRIDTTTGADTLISPAEPARYSAAIFSRDGKSIYVTSDRGGEFIQLWATDIAGAQWKPLAGDRPWDVDGIALAPRGRTLAFVTNEAGASVLRTVDTRTGRVRTVKGIPAGVIGHLRFAGKAEILAFDLSAGTDSGDVYTYDFNRRKLVRWTRSEQGGLAPDSLVAPTVVQYPTFDGAHVPALYWRPAGDGPFPVAVLLHPPRAQSRPRFDALAQYLVSRGIAVVAPDVRGSSGYGKTYAAMADHDLDGAAKDVVQLLAWIAAQPELSADHVAVVGGAMALAAVHAAGDRLVTAVITDGAGAEPKSYADVAQPLLVGNGSRRDADVLVHVAAWLEAHLLTR